MRTRAIRLIFTSSFQIKDYAYARYIFDLYKEELRITRVSEVRIARRLGALGGNEKRRMFTSELVVLYITPTQFRVRIVTGSFVFSSYLPDRRELR